MASVVVTGGSGKAGRAVIRDLTAHGYAVMNVDTAPSVEPQCHFLRADLNDLGETIDALQQAAGAVDVGGPLMLNRTELMLEAALQGLGIAFVPQRLAAPYLENGRLYALLEEWCPAYLGLFLYYPGHRQIPAGLRAFIDMLRATPIN